MGKMSRDKGKAGEREAAALLREWGFESARRGQQYAGGADSPDVVGLPGWHIEVKRTETLRLYPALEQMERDKAGTSKAVVFHRRSRKGWVAILRAEDFLELIREREQRDVEH